MTCGYEYGNARVRARRAELFDRDRYRQLVELDLDGFLAALSDTSYRPDLVAATPRFRGRRLLDEALRTNLARSLRELVGWYDGDARSRVETFVGLWDLRNVRTILRGQYAGADPAEVRTALVPAGALDDAVLNELAAQPGLRSAAELMLSWGVPTPMTARAVFATIPAVESSGELVALERVLDEAEAVYLNGTLLDVEPDVARIIRADIDRANLLMALRLREARAAGDAWDTARSAVPFVTGGTIPEVMLARVGRAQDRASAMAMWAESLPGSAWLPALARWSESGDLVALTDELGEMVTRNAAGLFSTADPLGAGVPLAYVRSKQNEVENLRAIGAAVTAGVTPELIEEELVILS